MHQPIGLRRSPSMATSKAFVRNGAANRCNRSYALEHQRCLGNAARTPFRRELDDGVGDELTRLAGDAVRLIGHRVGQGEDAGTAVAEVIGDLFGDPLTGTPERRDRIVAAILSIIGEPDRTAARP
jgi:hypothetical protein